ncbi:UNVERIFIED_CONTAM: hypothetical protein K2H54_040313 [Gekko kuhli]
MEINRTQTVKPQRNPERTVHRRACAGCGSNHERDQSWAHDLRCRNCNKQGHMARLYRAKGRKKTPPLLPGAPRKVRKGVQLLVNGNPGLRGLMIPENTA